MKDRIMTEEELAEDLIENIRPQKLVDYIGQKEVKDNIGVFIKSALIRNESLDLWPSWSW